MEAYKLDYHKFNERRSRLILYNFEGKVDNSTGLTFEAILPGASIGSICELSLNPETKPVMAEVVGFRKNRIILMPLKSLQTILSISIFAACICITL